MATIGSLPPELLSQILINSCDLLFSYKVHRFDILVHREAISAVCRAWRNLAFSTPRLWNLFYIWEMSDKSEDISDAVLRWERWLERCGDVPLEIYVQNPHQALLEMAWKLFSPLFHRVCVLELYLDFFHFGELGPIWTIPPLSQMPLLRRLYCGGRASRNEIFNEFVSMDRDLAQQMKSLQELVFIDLPHVPSLDLPLSQLIALQLTYRDDMRKTWKELSGLLSGCKALTYLILTFKNAYGFVEELRQATNTVVLPQLKALEIDQPTILHLIMAPKLSCLCRSGGFWYVTSRSPPYPLRYLRTPIPSDGMNNYSTWQEQISTFSSQIYVVELLGDDYVNVLAFLGSLLEDQANENGARPLYLPYLRVLIIRTSIRSAFEGHIHRGNRSFQLYAMAVRVLRHRPSLFIHNAQLYEYIETDPWTKLQEDGSGLALSAGAAHGMITATIPQRFPLLESRIKHIPRDTRRPDLSARPRSSVNLPAVDESSWALWDRLFATTTDMSTRAHPCCDVRLGEVWEPIVHSP